MVEALRGGETPLFTTDGKVNPKLSETDMETLGPTREVLIAEKDKEFEELDEIYSK